MRRCSFYYVRFRFAIVYNNCGYDDDIETLISGQRPWSFVSRLASRWNSWMMMMMTF